MAEFGIAEEPIRKNGDWYLAGRCVTDIHVGDRFTKFVPTRVEVCPNGERIYHRGEPVGIDLTVVQMTAYRKILEVIPMGMTAGILFRGDGENLQSFGSLVTD